MTDHRMSTSMRRSRWLHAFAIAAVTCVVYSNTFSVPFHFDDHLNIVENARIKDLGALWPPSGTRWFGYLTFALNYRFGGLDTTGYHVVNLAIHVLNALLVYGLVLLTFEAPYFASVGATINETQRTKHGLTALLASLLFAVHPVQTQAVTYIVQRFASLAALFCLLALTAYAQARLLSLKTWQGGSRDARYRAVARWSLYVCSLVCAVLAMETKENAFPLPVAIVLYELSFFGTPGRAQRPPLVSRVALVFPFLLTLLLIPLTMIGFGANLNDIGATFTASNEISRHDYLLTQLRVLVAYVRLLFWPVNQSIDHAVPVHHAFFEPAVFLSFLFLGSVFGVGCVLHFRSRASAHPARLIAFGIFWFFMMLSVESSVIPIGDVMVEHRLYLPSVGAWIALATAAVWVGDAVQRRARGGVKIVVALGAIVVAILSAAALVRNAVWRSELAVWEDVVTKYPEAARARNMLGTLYEESGWRTQAIDAYRTAIAVRPSYAEAHVNLGRALVAQGKADEGLGELMIALQYVQHMDEIDTAYLFASIGKCYGMKGLPDRELEYYNDALRLIPGDASIYVLIGQAYATKGMPEKAQQYFSRAHQLNPDRF